MPKATCQKQHAKSNMPKATCQKEHAVRQISRFMFDSDFLYGITFARLSIFLFISILTTVLICSCSHEQIKPWGSNTTFSPGWHHIKRSAKDSLFDHETWLPLAGAAVFGFSNLDARVANYAFESHPLFGSRANAIYKSDDLFDATKVALFTTSLTSAGADDFSDTMRMKSKGLLAQSMAIGLNNVTTSTLKVVANRTAPNEIDSDSLTSRHASGAFLYSSLTRLNIRDTTTSSVWHKSTDIAMIGLASATAWGRVEGGLHYPSDILVGAALGNFFANFVHRAFVDPDFSNSFSVQYSKRRVASELIIQYSF
jgi:hypothetical protein